MASNDTNTIRRVLMTCLKCELLVILRSKTWPLFWTTVNAFYPVCCVTSLTCNNRFYDKLIKLIPVVV